MHTTINFLDDLKAKCGLTSDYQISKFLKITQAAVSNYRNGKKNFDEQTALKVAHALEMDAAYVLACMEWQRAKCPEAREVWERIAAKFPQKKQPTILKYRPTKEDDPVVTDMLCQIDSYQWLHG